MRIRLPHSDLRYPLKVKHLLFMYNYIIFHFGKAGEAYKSGKLFDLSS